MGKLLDQAKDVLAEIRADPERAAALREERHPADYNVAKPDPKVPDLPGPKLEESADAKVIEVEVVEEPVEAEVIEVKVVEETSDAEGTSDGREDEDNPQPPSSLRPF